jgi:integrase
VKHQKGYIWLDRRRKCWFGRWYQAEIQPDGSIKYKQKAVKLCGYSDRYRTERDVRPLLDERLKPFNEGKVDARSTMTLAQYVDSHYLPYVKTELKPSTHNGYKNDWNRLLKPLVGNIILRDFTTKHGHDLLVKLRAKGLGRSSLHRAKTLLSAIFSHALNLGVLHGTNLVKEVKLPRTPAPKLTHGYTAQEIADMLNLFDQLVRDKKMRPAVALRAKVAIGLMFFAGLRPGEARGVTWEDYDERRRLLAVNRSVWRTEVTEPKTPESVKPVPVIEPLRTILGELREVDGNPQSGPILRTPRRKKVTTLNLDLFARRVVAPAVREANMPWFGWYACRRGIGTILATITKDANASKGLLRHSSLATTLQHYVLDVPEVTLRGMEQVEQLFGPLAAAPTKYRAANVQQAKLNSTTAAEQIQLFH